MTTAVRGRAGAALVVLALAGCSAGGSSTDRSAPSEAPGEAKQRMIAALKASDERPQRTLEARSHLTLPDSRRRTRSRSASTWPRPRNSPSERQVHPVQHHGRPGDESECGPELDVVHHDHLALRTFVGAVEPDGERVQADVDPRAGLARHPGAGRRPQAGAVVADLLEPPLVEADAIDGAQHHHEAGEEHDETGEQPCEESASGLGARQHVPFRGHPNGASGYVPSPE